MGRSHSGGVFRPTLISLAGLVLGWWFYGREPVKQEDDVVKNWLGGFYKVLENKYYFDEAYFWFITNVYNRIAAFCNWCEVNIVIGFGVNGTAYLTRKSGAILRLSQTGKVQGYAFILLLGLSVIVFLSILL